MLPRSRSRDACAPFDDEAAALLEAGLGYELTAGQRQCWEDVEEDMCRRLAPMDRLVFGDVGVRADIDRRFGTPRPNFDSADFWTHRSLSTLASTPSHTLTLKSG